MERHYFRSLVVNRSNRLTIRGPEGIDIWIQFQLYKVTRSCLFVAPSRLIDGPENFITHANAFMRLRDVKNLSKRSLCTQVIAEKLSIISVPEDEHAAIIEKVFCVLEKIEQEAVQGVIPISAAVFDVTLRYLEIASAADVDPLDPEHLIESIWLGSRSPWLDQEDRRMIHDINAMQSMGIYGPEPKLIPATNSFIDGLEKVIFDSLESSTRQMPCAICMESLDHFALEGTDQQQMITRLPCSHLYHGDCVERWLESNHMCPLCRYPMPTVEVRMEAGEEEPPEPSRSWNMCMMSGVLAAATCFTLQMLEKKLKLKLSDYLFYAVPLVACYSAKLW